MEMTQRDDSQRALRRQLRQRLEWGRMAILVLVAVSLLNQILLWCGVRFHFLTAPAMTYYINWLARQLDMGGFKVLATMMTLLLYVAYLACWLLSARKKEWMMAALGLYGVDTVLLVVFALVLLENPASCLLEVLVHCLILALLFFAFQAAERLSKIPRRRRPIQNSQNPQT